MDINQDNLFNNFFSQLLPFLFSLLDDVFFLGLSRLGVHIESLQWLSSLILTYTIISWAFRLLRYAFSQIKLSRFFKGWVELSEEKPIYSID